ncbi:unnamed protein product [Gongylonema pulchrum]|uniref:BED-type domain-containing protein n=1 Tax=Gongylonema pulchrum TaxID=637853 RepID=A0A183EG73_9BILA|nr:unnamed protein product [Gongylonema pulchrum]
MSLAVPAEAPQPKKFRLSLPTQVVVQRPSFTYQNSSSPLELDEAANRGQSPAAPSSARSSSTTSCVKEERDDFMTGTNGSNNLLFQKGGKSLVDVLSNAMILQATNAFIKVVTTVPSGPPIPGAIAVAASPAAALFGEDDWSWHRNPAAAIRSGGTNKQTPVWKYFVYNKAENLSRCIVGNCTYMLKGPHTSTLACHLKKHPNEYVEFQKLKVSSITLKYQNFDH